MEETIKEYYENNDLIFEDMVLKLFQKGDQIVYDVVKDLANGLMKQPNYGRIIKEFKDLYLTTDKLELMFKEFEQRLVHKLRYAKYQASLLINALKGYSESVDKYLNDIVGYFSNEIEDYNYQALHSHVIVKTFPRKPSSSNDDVLKELLNQYHDPIRNKINEIKDIMKELKFQTEEEAIKNVLSTKRDALKFVEIAKKYIIKLHQQKVEQSLFDFSDIMNLAIMLLEDNKDIRDQYKNNIKEIMIDEYQDTNDIQDYFISLISNNNLFMVGDIKQSIYGFRDANPYNFRDRYNDYKDGKHGELIVLRENFRSRESIINDINLIFNHVMDDYIGGINYQDNQSLIYGQIEYDRKNPGQNYGIDLIQYDLEKARESELDVDNTLLEARLLAKDIRNKIDNGFLILEENHFRPAKYSDMAILIDRKTSFSKISEILSEYNIPVNLYSDEPFLNSPEMLFLISYLKLLNCFYDKNYLRDNLKKSLYSVARSFVFQIKDEDIIHFFVENDEVDSALLTNISDYPPFSMIWLSLKEILNVVDVLPMHQLIVKIYQTLDIYSHIALLDNPGKKEEKLDYFVETIKQFERFDFPQLMSYLDVLESNPDWDIEYSTTNPEKDAVKLMTMHKSKGLQFPVVYLPGLNKQFNISENQNMFMYDKYYGLITPVFEDGFIKTFPRFLYLEKVKMEYISERIRLFYVACTRAKEHLILFADKSNLLEGMDVLQGDYVEDEIRSKYRRYTDLISSTPIRKFKYKNHPSIDIEVPERVIHKYGEMVNIKEFKFEKILFEEERFSKGTTVLLDDDTIQNMKYGDKVHKLLEYFDYSDVEESLQKLPQRIRESMKILLESSIFDFDKQIEVYQEYEFYDLSDGLIRRGIIDLMVEYDEIIYIIDYKLKNITDDAYFVQLKAYKEYIQSISKKPVKTYLYSILHSKLDEVE